MKQEIKLSRLCQRAFAGGIIAAVLCMIGQAGAQSWWVGAGPVWRGCMDVKFSGSSYAQALGLNTDVGIGIGAGNAYADRTYDNGYVGLAPSTGSPKAVDPNTTWNWGYNASSTAGQYEAGGTLSFQRRGIPRYSSLANGGSGGEDDMLGAGLRLQAGLPLKQGDKWSVDIVFGFQGIWSDGKYRENAALADVTDRYNVAGINSTAFTDLNHRGAYNGPFDPAATAPYAVIPNLPARGYSASALTPATQSSIAFDVDQSLYAFSLGPQVGVKAGNRLQFVATPTISLNIVDLDVHRSETFAYGGTVSQWSSQAGNRQVYLGFGLTGGANLDLGKGWFTGVFGGYEWVMENVDLAVGPNRVSVDAGGWTAGAVFGRRF